MSMALGPGSGEDDLVAVINTTPLVDVMLVLLIIFLITIPVVTHSVPVALPKEANQPTRMQPDTVTIAVDRMGSVYWNEQPLPEMPALLERMKAVAVLTPQPEIHIRGDRDARYEIIGRVVTICQRAGIVKVGFITEPPAHGN